MLNERVITIALITWLIKMILLYKISYYPEPISHIKNRKVELDFYNHVSKSDV